MSEEFSSALKSGSLIHDRYRLDELIGQGGNGVVYRALDTLLHRDVAVKFLQHSEKGSESHLRLLREAQAAAGLNHPNIVSIYDAGVWENDPFIIMELITGETLSPSSPRTSVEVIAIARQICASLDHAHSNGVVHRDLKPDNILVASDGTVKLMDFGLARTSIASRLTVEGAIVGTVHYMAPEQALGLELDGRADLYSLGVLLYELVASRLPFSGDNPLAVITQHIHSPITPPRAFNESIPAALEDLILRLLNKQPADRPQSAREVLKALETIENPAPGTSDFQEITLLDRIVRGQLVGREREFTEAKSRWQEVISGKGGVLLISGEPGIGKTRFARELTTLANLSGGKSLLGECYPEGGTPYAPLAQIIRSALREGSYPDLPEEVTSNLLALAPDLHRYLPRIKLNPPLDVEYEQQRLFESIVDFCHKLTSAQPLLIMIEDVHWGDGGTLRLIQYLARRSQNHRLMIVLTYRELELDEQLPLHQLLLDLNRERLSTRIKLLRLSKVETHTLLASMFAEEITNEFLDGIYLETEGNPFFIEEVCKALVESGKLDFSDGRWVRPIIEELEIPQSIHLAIQARISKLSSVSRTVLNLAAVIGREFDFEVLASAAKMDDESLISALEEAEKAQLIGENSDPDRLIYSFAHALIPAALYESISSPRRRLLHRLVGGVYEALQPESLEALAYHFTRAGNRDSAILYNHKAGKRASHIFAYDAAVQYLNQALHLTDQSVSSDRRLALLEDLADANLKLGRRKEAVSIYQQALQVSIESHNQDRILAVRLYRKIVEAIAKMTWLEDRMQHADLALTMLQFGLDITQAEPPNPESVRLQLAYFEYAYSVMNPIDWDLAEKHARIALDLANQVEDPLAKSAALWALGIVYGMRGLLRERLELAKQRVELIRDQDFQNPIERASSLIGISVSHIQVGEFLQAMPFLELAISLSSQIQAVDYQVDAMRYYAVCLFHLDRWSGVIAMEEKLRSLESRYANFLDRTGTTCFFLALISAVHSLQGDSLQASRVRDESRAIMIAAIGPIDIWQQDNHY